MNTKDRYLRAIYLIQVTTNEPAGTGAIAERLDISPASANEMIGKLESDSLAEHEKYEGVTLTEAGIEQARESVETYCIIERFLHSVLGIEAYREEASQLEGVIDATVAERLDTIIDRRPECPDCFDAETDQCAFLGDSETDD
ncbi:iron-dependent repressor [Halorubrum sp. DM2]|uniref:metal-dependent transcriptional regulator n=1 Tax=Halorubrum sp. DM2 TaxID=2527867 RepID=UPI0024B6D6AB|nr:metal-dependent transcriptional regulator [Halorubrum sp. DM2]VTT85142.1 iron-dependent repressor [Halorubrum sp. DM2]